MSVSIKSAKELQLMREAGRLLEITHNELQKAIKPGISTWEIDRLGEQIIRSFGCTPSFLHYNGYPASICVSVNDEVVHGIPSRHRILQEGDIVSLDAGLIYKGFHSDSARTHAVGKIAPEVHRLYEISAAIGNYVKRFGYSPVEDLVGHGIGRELHEDPQVPNFPQKKRGIRLVPGMTLAIEPMINMGRCDVEWLEDDWTVVTEDGSLSAHYENTILITDGEPEIFTLSE